MTVPVAAAVALAVFLLAARWRPIAQPRSAIATVFADDVAGDVPLRLLEHVERELRVGSTLAEATRSALAVRPAALPALRQALDAEASLGAALAAVEAGNGDELVVTQTLRACARTGGRMGAAVDRAVLVLRERHAWRRERRVQAAQARLSATVLTLVPLVFAGWGTATSERIRRAYVEIPLCGLAAVAGLALNLIGWLWMRRLVRGTDR